MTNTVVNEAGQVVNATGTDRYGLTSVSWSPGEGMSFPNWAEQGRRFGLMSRCSQWWIGDWVRYGDAAYGAKYDKASKITSYDVQSLMNMVYAASRFEISRRRENLSWSHHVELAALDPGEQDRWLDWCEEKKASVHDLRWELRRVRHINQLNGENGSDSIEENMQSAEADGGDPVKCPECGYEFRG